MSLSMILINPVSAAGVNVPVPVVAQGSYVFIGESGLDISAALAGQGYVGWWPGGVDVKTTQADTVIAIAAGTETNYFVDPALYTQQGRYYLCNAAGNAFLVGGNEVLAFIVETPQITLVPVDTICPDVNRTGQVFMGTFLNFKIMTNLYHIQNRDATAPGIFDIKVLGSNGKDYNFLINPVGTEESIKDIKITANNHVWQTWDTAGLDIGSGLIFTPPGSYEISVTCWANNIIDHTSGAISATTTLSLVPETVDVSVNPGTIYRTQTATATVTGKPVTEYIIGFVECPLKMTGEVCDRPPWFVNDTLNTAISFDSIRGGPIGSTEVYPSCCDGLRFMDVAPSQYLNGLQYYARIITDCNGIATIDIDVDNTVWKADENPVYTIHVQKVLQETDGVHLFDETELTVQKGDMTIQISQASDTTNAPITEAYLGDVLKIAGVNSDSTVTYLYMTGPCQPECGGGLIPVPYPHGPIGDGPEIVPILQPQVEGFDWIFTNSDITGNARFWETGYLPINPGTYTIYAVSNWPLFCPECLDCGGDVCIIEDCPNCDVYAVATIELKAPELSAIVDDYERCCCPGYPCGTTIDNHPLIVSGISTGNPMKELNVWLFGKGKIGNEKYINTKIPVDCDGEFKFDIQQLLASYGVSMCEIDLGTYDLIIQDPGYNHQFDVILEDDLDPTYWAIPVEVNKKWILSSYPDIGPVQKYNVDVVQNVNPYNDFLTRVDIVESRSTDPGSQKFYDDDWRKLVQVDGPGYKLGTEVLRAVIRGLEDPSVDDNYVHIQFKVSDRPCFFADFEADRTYGNKPLSVKFTDLSLGGSSWLWNFGDGQSSTEQHPTHVYENEGRYTVSLTIDGDAGNVVKNDYIRVAKGPTAQFEYTPKDVKAGETEVQFTDLSLGNPTSWMWHFGDGASSPLQSPVYTYSRPGVYNVRLTVSDEIGLSSQSATQTVTVTGDPVPEVFAGFRTVVSGGTTVQFIDESLGDPTAWSWDFGDGRSSAEQNPVHTYFKEGTYQVTLTVSNDLFIDSFTKPVGIR